MCRPAAFLLAAFLLGTVADPAGAGIRGFYPGDAFFHTTLTKELADSLRQDAATPLPYHIPEHTELHLCGYSGYWYAALPKDSPLADRIADFYDRRLKEGARRKVMQIMNDDGTVTEYETNGYRLFLYNADYNPFFYGIGLKYSENWVERQMAFGVDRRRTQLDTFLLDPQSISRDWRDAAEIAELDVTCPPPPPTESVFGSARGFGAKVEQPVTFNGPIKAVITTDRNLKRYVKPRRWDTFFVVTEEGVTRYVYDPKERIWEGEDWPKEAAGDAEKDDVPGENEDSNQTDDAF
ncbi:MAG: hypothetical protein AAF907_08665 [Planctomycetota bacterium]